MSEVHVVFIHGLANKPGPDVLRRVWLQALAASHPPSEGFDLEEEGVYAHFVYWANHFYDSPLEGSDYESAVSELEAEAQAPVDEVSGPWAAAMRENFPTAAEADEVDAPVDGDDAYERIPIPWVVKGKLLGHFLREAHDYLFDVDGLRGKIQGEVLELLNSLPEDARIVFVGHSQGSFIAYDVLTLPECREVHGFMTVGSPLGLDEVQDKLSWSREDGYPQRLSGDWVNVFDPYDVVSRPDPRLANDFRKGGLPIVIDIEEPNWGRWRHSATKYLKGARLRGELRRLCDREV